MSAKPTLFLSCLFIPAFLTACGQAKTVEVRLQGLAGIPERSQVFALHPGVTKKAAVEWGRDGATVVLTVPVQRGCAMVQVQCQAKLN